MLQEAILDLDGNVVLLAVKERDVVESNEVCGPQDLTELDLGDPTARGDRLATVEE